MNDERWLETLEDGAEFWVSRRDWGITYVWPGPDRRYNPTFTHIPGHSIDRYIEALRTNWKEYEKLIQSVPAHSDLEKPGREGMTIRVARFCMGVCLDSHHGCMHTRGMVLDRISSFKYARDRALEVQVKHFGKALDTSEPRNISQTTANELQHDMFSSFYKKQMSRPRRLVRWFKK